MGVTVDIGTAVSVEATLSAGAHEAKIKATSKTMTMFLILIDTFLMQGTAQRFALADRWAGVDSAWEQNTKRPQQPALSLSKHYHPDARAGRFVS
jgi:hypothetical protein